MGPSHIESLEDRKLFATYTPDVTFGSDGSLATQTDHAPFVAVRDGGIIAGGLFRDETTGPRYYVNRFHGDGTPDRDFGARPIALGDEATEIGLVGVDSQTRAFITASNGNVAYINRLRSNGSRDRGFAATLKPAGSTLRSTTVDQVQPLPDGGVLAVVRVASATSVSTYLAQLSSTGVLNLDFGLDGYAAIGRTSAGDTTPPAVWLATNASGGIYVSVEGQHGIVKLFANGVRDTSFGTNGVIRFVQDPKPALDSADRLLAYDPSTLSLLRYTTRGKPDPTFGQSGRVPVLSLAGSPETTISLLPQSDSLVYLQVEKSIARFRDDGTLDTRFDRDGIARLLEAGPILARLPAGQFLQRNGTDVQAVDRLKNVALGRSGTLYVTGESASDSVDIRTTRRAVNVTFGSDAFTFKLAAVNRISANLGRGDNVFTSTAALSTLVITADGRDRVTTGNGDDAVYTGAGSDRIFTFGGNDRLYPGPINNTIDGGDGTDVYYSESNNDLIAGIEETRPFVGV